jgi:hypothetical protein
LIIIIEKFVFKDLLSSGSFAGIPSQHLSDKLNSLWTCPVNNLVQRNRIILIEINFILSHENLTFGPLSRRAQNLANFIQLIYFGASAKQWRHEVQFGHDASQCKNIHRGIVIIRFENYLWSSVPTRGNVVGERGTRPDFSG